LAVDEDGPAASFFAGGVSKRRCSGGVMVRFGVVATARLDDAGSAKIGRGAATGRAVTDCSVCGGAASSEAQLVVMAAKAASNRVTTLNLEP
jgi:hypothetical protein